MEDSRAACGFHLPAAAAQQLLAPEHQEALLEVDVLDARGQLVLLQGAQCRVVRSKGGANGCSLRGLRRQLPSCSLWALQAVMEPAEAGGRWQVQVRLQQPGERELLAAAAGSSARRRRKERGGSEGEEGRQAAEGAKRQKIQQPAAAVEQQQKVQRPVAAQQHKLQQPAAAQQQKVQPPPAAAQPQPLKLQQPAATQPPQAASKHKATARPPQAAAASSPTRPVAATGGQAAGGLTGGCAAWCSRGVRVTSAHPRCGQAPSSWPVP